MKRIFGKYKYLFILSSLLIFTFFGSQDYDFSEQSYVKNTTISLVSEENVFMVDQIFPVNVVVDTEKAANAFEATIHFPQDSVEVVGISKKDSIVNIWVQEPSFSNELGIIEFVGGIFGFKEFIGNDTLVTLFFKPNRSGKISIDFFEAAVLASDGKGTDILKEKIGAEYLIKDSELSSLGLNGSGLITIYDLSIFFSNLWKVYDPKYDFNQDGEIDLIDVSILMSSIGRE